MNPHFQAMESRFWNLVPDGAEVKQLATGMAFTEGPVWLEAAQCVLFTDIPNNAIMRWDTKDGLGIRNTNAHYAIGLCTDPDGRVMACEHTTRRLTRYEHDGSRTVLASHHGAFVLNSTNDVCVRSDGAVFFTDPPFGVRLDDTGDLVGYQQGMEYGACGVFKVTPDPTRPTLVTDAIYRPNGVCFSSDERTLYVSDSSDTHHRVHALELNTDDTVKSDRVFAMIEPGVPDGMCVDAQDQLYVSTLDGVQVFESSGALIGKILVPEMVTNLCFGGPQQDTLFITAVTSLYAVRLNTKGARR
jgi:gluconolactonase